MSSTADSEISARMTWLRSNELNSAYAADGYARVKEHSIGVVLTTYVLPWYMPAPSKDFAS